LEEHIQTFDAQSGLDEAITFYCVHECNASWR